jgi:hypothetical protein
VIAHSPFACSISMLTKLRIISPLGLFKNMNSLVSIIKVASFIGQFHKTEAVFLREGPLL